MKYQEEAVDWLRVRDEYSPEKGYSLWGDNGISVNDIRQGESGNCWFLAAASALAEEPERLEEIFVNEDDEATKGISHNGIYAFRMYALMMPITVIIDDRLPMKKEKEGKTMYAKVGRDMSVWSPLLEKA